MNPYFIFILATIVVTYILDRITNVLNIKSLNSALPKEFEGIYSSEKYAKSQEYTRAQTNFSQLVSTFDLAVLIAFWFSGGFAWLDMYARSFGYNSIATGLIFIGLLAAANSVISLPFSIYGTFVLEERFGFNKTTVKTFITDLLKGLALSIVLGVPVIAAVLWFFESAGQFGWLYCWIALTVFMLAVQFIVPTWIMPLFNKFTPIEDGELKTAILEYSKSVNFPLKGIFVIDGSRRSSKSNAFFTGFGKNKRIALFDTLIEQQSVPELVGIVAHEVGHYKRKHIVQSMILGILQSGAMFFLLSLFLNNKQLFAAFHVTELSVYAGLVFFFMLYSPISEILGIAMNIISRKNEFEADEFAGKTTENPSFMISALKKLSSDNLSNLTPHPLFVFLNYSHPPVLDRIRALAALKL